MTEKEAMKAPCIGPVPNNTGIMGSRADRYLCRGSACKMAWRWDNVPNPNYRPFQVWPSDQLGTNPSYLKSTTDGHCGLAGRP